MGFQTLIVKIDRALCTQAVPGHHDTPAIGDPLPRHDDLAGEDTSLVDNLASGMFLIADACPGKDEA